VITAWRSMKKVFSGHGARLRRRCWKPSCTWRPVDLSRTRDRWRRGAQAVSSAVACNRAGRVKCRRGWVRFGCSGGGGTTAGRVRAAGARPTRRSAWRPYQQTSDGLARWEAALGALTTFREAAKLLAELAGVQVGSESLRTQAERVGTNLEGQQRRTMAYVEQLHEPPADEHDPAPGTLVVETDGVMVRYRDRHLDGAAVEGDWHEVKLGLVGGWQHGHLQQPSYVAAREAAPAFARRLGSEAARRGALDVVKWHPWDGTPAELRSVVVLGDGANPLTPREQEVLTTARNGAAVSEIAASLALSEGTVRNYLCSHAIAGLT
jgi:Bacterial regulatory proteins, luxR family